MPKLSNWPPPEESGGTDWMQVRVVAPPEVVAGVLDFLQERFGYQHIPSDIDWCVYEREEDFSQATYGPSEAITKNAYVVDWRKGEGRGDVPVAISDPTSS